MPKKSGKNLNLALIGASGKMGVEILALAGEADCKIVAYVNGPKDWQSIKKEEVDVVIEFSAPDGLKGAIDWCVANKKPLVSGTTGLADDVRKAIATASKKIPILYSANMSLGVAVLSKMLHALAAVKDWDFQIQEAHHAQKKDKPSGTAWLLQDVLEEVTGQGLPTPISIRGGSVAGIHEVWAMGQDETLILQHSAANRRVFARGALTAARWLHRKKQPGLYGLSDLY